MPDVVLHAVFGEAVLETLTSEEKSLIQPDPFRFALLGPDVWFLYRPWKRRSGRGREMHTTRTGRFLTSLADAARNSRDPAPTLSYLAGFLCHYALDATAHPYIISRTTGEEALPGAHRSFEHTLDNLELERRGLLQTPHPVTEGGFLPKLRLPEALKEDLNRVYGEVYGWQNSWQALNRAYVRFRWVYRRMELRRGLLARLARRTGKPVFRSLAYSESYYGQQDAENTGKKRWTDSFDPSVSSEESFAELWEKALRRAVEMIRAAIRYAAGQENRDRLAEIIGNDSYLSGRAVDDPRNWTVPSMLPPYGPAETDGTPEKEE